MGEVGLYMFSNFMANVKKILHIDNDKAYLEHIKTVLEPADFEVTSLAEAEKSVEMVKKGEFDLVLLDIMLPGLTGWDIFTKIKDEKPDQKIAFLTVLDITPDRLDALQKMGISAYFTKPVNEDEFPRKIRDIVGM